MRSMRWRRPVTRGRGENAGIGGTVMEVKDTSIKGEREFGNC